MARKQIGRDLTERYQVPEELPPKLQTLIMKVDAIKVNQLLSYSGDYEARIRTALVLARVLEA